MIDKYIHLEENHNLAAPLEIVPKIIELLKPNSVVDIGCGLGTFLYCFKQYGVNKVLGIDGPWVKRDLLSKYLNEEEFLERDLEQGFNLDNKFDLVLCLEVAEHLSVNVADDLVKNLVNAGGVILFSAAIPQQGGFNHINEQWITYWEEKFNKHGYVLKDIIRPLFWDNPKIFWWYKQNMILFTPEGFKLDNKLIQSPFKKVVHYELFLQQASHLEKTQKELKSTMDKLNDFTFGRASRGLYLKSFIKSLIGYRNTVKLIALFNTQKANN